MPAVVLEKKFCATSPKWSQHCRSGSNFHQNLRHSLDIFQNPRPKLVGGIPTPLKNMSSSVGMIIPNIWKNKKCSKPPTRQCWAKMSQQPNPSRKLDQFPGTWNSHCFQVCRYTTTPRALFHLAGEKKNFFSNGLSDKPEACEKKCSSRRKSQPSRILPYSTFLILFGASQTFHTLKLHNASTNWILASCQVTRAMRKNMATTTAKVHNAYEAEGRRKGKKHKANHSTIRIQIGLGHQSPDCGSRGTPF